MALNIELTNNLNSGNYKISLQNKYFQEKLKKIVSDTMDPIEKEMKRRAAIRILTDLKVLKSL